jgi:hypothetical protein
MLIGNPAKSPDEPRNDFEDANRAHLSYPLFLRLTI